ncbi:Hsp20/alpha crystallin family protein [Shimia sediminis]|uniref:Hsp20/alpha crystallin family protein n=1 Tax=Shimia sediminis TaxID=2497945 RepID=UPI000F8CA6BE|nr:Hsp20/alpha crystallin family protein [Shimia sediminis]
MVEKSHAAGLWPSLYEPFRHMGSRLADWLSPASEASADSGTYRIAMELPGVSEDDVELTVEGGVVAVKGEKKVEREEQGDTWFFSERQYGAFSRSFRLPADADEGSVRADLKDGVLTITVSKLTPQDSTAKTVKISRG